MKSGTFIHAADPRPPPPPQVRSPCCWTAPGQPPSSLGVPWSAWSWTGSALNACWDCAQRSWRGTSRDTTASSPSPCDTSAAPPPPHPHSRSGRHQQRPGVISIPDLGGKRCGIRVKNISFTSCRVFLHLSPPPLFPFCKSLFFFDGVPFELCCHVALCKTTTATCRSVKVRPRTAPIDHLSVHETCVQCVSCMWCMFVGIKRLLHFYEVTKILGKFRKQGTKKVMLAYSRRREYIFLCWLSGLPFLFFSFLICISVCGWFHTAVAKSAEVWKPLVS